MVFKRSVLRFILSKFFNMYFCPKAPVPFNECLLVALNNINIDQKLRKANVLVRCLRTMTEKLGYNTDDVKVGRLSSGWTTF